MLICVDSCRTKLCYFTQWYLLSKYGDQMTYETRDIDLYEMLYEHLAITERTVSFKGTI